MPLTPNAIYEDFKNRDLDFSSALQLLITLIENTDNIDTRLESIEILEKIQAKDDRVFKLLENLLISDSNKEIRNVAAHFIKTHFLNRALKPMKWALEHETAIKCIITVISTLSEINNEKSKSILIDKLNYFYNQELKYNLKDLFISKRIENFTLKDLSEILINYFFIKFLKIKFGYIKFEFDNSGFITKLDLTNVDPQGIFLTDFLDLISSLKHLRIL
ncbi:MAG: HEAT repeat domain-containing protein, partial [Candidatus Lokiarchaeota archaeon]|nr:HEAT repeat domain-containing protein [Candidatus Lokiarchaeota archaeon]